MDALVLTRNGYEQWRASPGRSLLVNKDVLAAEELQALRQAGVEVEVLPRRLAPNDRAGIDDAVRLFRRKHHRTLWVEHPMPEQDATVAAGVAAVQQDSHAKAPSIAGIGRRWSRQALTHIKRAASPGARPIIIPYMGFGTAERLFLQGRVLRDEGFATPHPEETPWRNIVEMSKRMGADEVPGARLLASYAGVEQELVTDSGGYFQAEMQLPRPLTQPGWHEIALQLLSPRPRSGYPGEVARVLVPPPSAKFGVISDVDDTVLWSNVGNKLRMLTMLAVKNAHTRKPFKGVTALYAALRDGVGGDEGNPIFYVSSSPWHLYTPLTDFFAAQQIPLGPLMLKRLKLRTMFGAGRHHGHKLENIERIMSLYPHLPFILIGDSGQKDPEIYGEVVARHPNRIRAIYIRSVTPDPERIEALDRLIEEMQASGTQLVLVPDSEYAAAHAAAEGLIRPLELRAVRSDKRADEQPSAPLI